MDKDKLKDVGYAITKAGLGSIPIAGAAASELLSLIVASPLEKRRDKWMIEIGERLKKLEDKGTINLESLKDNPSFIDTILQTTQLAIRTSDNEKIGLFQNVLINSALIETPDQAETQIFLNLIETFTTWHIRILKLFDNPPNWLKSNNKTIPNFMGAGLSSILEIAYPELTGRSDFYNLIWDDLHRAGLHNSGSLKTIMSSNGLMANRTTEFGKRFLRFIEISDTEQ
jgi:hypothetical protein